MSLFIDSHQDIAFNLLSLQRDYRHSVLETRKNEQDSDIPAEVGQALLGWPEYQKANLALIFGTLFILPNSKVTPLTVKYTYDSFVKAKKLYQAEIDLYHNLAQQSPDMFRLILCKSDLNSLIDVWKDSPAQYPQHTNPVGIVILMEGAEGIANPAELNGWWEQGLRMVGPVWDGGRFCGSSTQPGTFTNEGKDLLRVMSELGMALDISHMDTQSTIYALDHFNGQVFASHANVLNLVPGFQSERLFKDETIRGLIDRDSVMGIMPVNFFLKAGWHSGDDRSVISINLMLNHIDYVCQLAGSARHVAIGTDFDGGLGLRDVPYEINSISDIQLISTGLENRGYQTAEIDAICYGNWLRMLERILPLNG
ncbi:MAG: membrane dipeptidase [Anaerolineaceae bacterium]|nr:membrane dipeptidase [Anaerolineaceae bacterium]